MSTKWIPTEQPYRVIWYRNSSAPGCYGWTSETKAFATLDDARDAMKAPFKAGVYKAEIDMAINAHDWQKSGRWSRVESRKRLASQERGAAK